MSNNIISRKLLLISLIFMLCGCSQIINYSIPPSNELAFVDGPEIWTMDANGENKQLLLRNKSYIITDISWSPDGKKIAFTHYSSENKNIFGEKEIQIPNLCNLKIIDLCTKKIINLLKRESVISNIIWTSSGKEIIFSEEGDIYIFDIVHKNCKKLVSKNVLKGRNIYFPSLPPDGNNITFQTYDLIGRGRYSPVTHKVYLMNLKEKKVRRLTNNPPEVNESIPVWSPDGKWIAFEMMGSKSNVGLHIALINLENRQQHEIHLPQKPELFISEITFSPAPEGKKIIFETIRGEIYSIDIDGKNLKNLTNTSDCYEASPSWRPIVKD